MSELVLTAYDIRGYLREAFPAMRAAIYRGDLSQAKDVLALYDETLYAEYDIAGALLDNDYSWVFTDEVTDPAELDPNGEIIGLTYPLILSYYKPEVCQISLSETLFNLLLSTAYGHSSQVLRVEPGHREGLRAMWEVLGYLPPEAVGLLHEHCVRIKHEPSLHQVRQKIEALCQHLPRVIHSTFGLIIERE